ncbi:MAG: hypothetical protein IJU76_00465 [Desulfovibrionaceae bacterium]|nr:hypothetical protein [Desulfovibrionaceae bacterium]
MRDSTVYLAIRDWLHEASLSLCSVLALASILSPLLILHGVHTGVVERLRERLMQDPSVLVVMPQGGAGAGFTQERIDQIQDLAECTFCIGRTRDVASELSVVGAKGTSVTITLEPTAQGDPLLARYHASPPAADKEKLEIVLSYTAARRLSVSSGDRLTARMSRRLASGQFERKTMELIVSAVLPQEAIGMDTGFLALPLLLAIQDFRDGYASELLATGGETPPSEHRFESFRAYVASLDDVEGFDAWCTAQGIPVTTRSKDIATIRNIDRTLTSIILVIAATTGAGFFAFMVSTVHASIRRKWKMLGMLRLIGFSRLSILAYPITQTLTTGLLGVLLSFVVYGCIAYCIDLLFAAESGGEAICVVHALDFLFIAVLVQVIIQIAAWKISLQASRIDPSLAIRES